jgi:hypothetical protein
MCKEVTIDPAEHNWHQRIGNCSVSAWLDLQLAQKHSPPLSLFSHSRRLAQLDEEAAILPSTLSLHTAVRVIKLLQLIQHMLHINFEQSIANISS